MLAKARQLACIGGSVATDLQDFSRTLLADADQLWTISALRPDRYAQPVLALIAVAADGGQVRGGPRRACPAVQGPSQTRPGGLSGQRRKLPPRERPFLAVARIVRQSGPRSRA